MTDSSSRDIDLDRVLAVADQMSGARSESLKWLHQPLREFKGEKPHSLVMMGRVDDVIGYLHSISSGFVG